MDAKRLVQYRVVASHTNEPMFAWAAWRMLDAADRYNGIKYALDAAASAWSSHLYARAGLDDVEGTVELRFDGVNEELASLGRQATTLASEAVHHVRTALDYCAHHAAWIDSGKRNNSSQFPLEETQSQWSKRVRDNRWLRGVSKEHVEWIREVQPFSGVEWAKLLKRLSNHDKHRVAVQVIPAYGVTIDFDQALTPDPLGEQDHVGLPVVEREIELLLDDAFAPEQADLPLLLPVLWEIIEGATSIVNRFLEHEGNEPLIVS